MTLTQKAEALRKRIREHRAHGCEKCERRDWCQALYDLTLELRKTDTKAHWSELAPDMSSGPGSLNTHPTL